jgi:hypothetical protein
MEEVEGKLLDKVRNAWLSPTFIRRRQQLIWLISPSWFSVITLSLLFLLYIFVPHPQVLKLGDKTLIDPLSLRDVIPTGNEAKITVQLKWMARALWMPPLISNCCPYEPNLWLLRCVWSRKILFCSMLRDLTQCQGLNTMLLTPFWQLIRPTYKANNFFIYMYTGSWIWGAVGLLFAGLCWVCATSSHHAE